jgi:hypothetical protein
MPGDWDGLGKYLVENHDFRLVAVVPTLALLSRSPNHRGELSCVGLQSAGVSGKAAVPATAGWPEAGMSLVRAARQSDGRIAATVRRRTTGTRGLRLVLLPSPDDLPVQMLLLAGMVPLSDVPKDCPVTLVSAAPVIEGVPALALIGEGRAYSSTGPDGELKVIPLRDLPLQ